VTGSGIAVSADSLVSFLFISTYLCASLVLCLKLLPRLSRSGKRLASVMLAAQVIVIVMSLVTGPKGDFQAWLWSIGNEWTIESVLSSTQFALVGLVALLISWLDTAERPWRRLYIAATAMLFLFLGLDEYFAWKNYIHFWTDSYFSVGILFATITLIVIETSPGPARQWLIVLVLGAATVALGGIVFDNFMPSICDVNLGFIRLDGCANYNLFEELLELFGGWIAALAVLMRLKEVIPSESARVRWILYTFPALWILLLLQSDAIHPLKDQMNCQPAAVEFESGVALPCYQTKLGANHLTLNLYISQRDWDFQQLGYSLHLVDQASGESIASQDEMLTEHQEFYVTPGFAPAYRQWAAIPLPANKPVNHALSIVLSIWRKEGDKFPRQRIVASDHQTMSDTQVVLGEVVFPPETTSSASGVFKNGFVLVAVEMPTTAQPGDRMPITFFWASEKDANEDYSQFLHLRHEASGEWWVYDQQPLGPRLPTRLWYSGFSDSEVWHVPLPDDLAPGRYEAFTGLYGMRDEQRVPVKSAGGQPWPNARARLGVLTIES